MWLCLCECGKSHVVAGKHLREGRVVSCGCKKSEKRVTEEHKKSRIAEYKKANKEVYRIAQRQYRERNLEVVRKANRERLAEYRKQNAGLTVLEAVTNVDAFWSRVALANKDDCWNWAGARTDRGYGVYAPLPGVLLRAHRVAYALHNGGIDDSMFVCHHCDNPSCCNPHHLFLGTPKDNVDDMIKKGRKVVTVGEANAMSKLTSDQVRSIFQDLRTNREVAAEYGISPSLVSMIRHRKIWVEKTSDLPNNTRRKTGPKPTRIPNAQLQALTQI